MSNMTDIVASEARSRMMSNIRGKNTRPEILVRRFLHGKGLRFRLHDKNLPGTPDIVFARHCIVIFVHGCFWHRHEGCKYASSPSSNVDFWQNKFAGNIKRDREAIAALIKRGWTVVVLWECGLRKGNIDESLDWLPQTISGKKRGLVEWPLLSPETTP